MLAKLDKTFMELCTKFGLLYVYIALDFKSGFDFRTPDNVDRRAIEENGITYCDIPSLDSEKIRLIHSGLASSQRDTTQILPPLFNIFFDDVTPL